MSVKVTVIVPVFNAADTLRRTLDSIRQQTSHELEVICIDDCSTDDSPQILKDYSSNDPRFKIISLQKNSGVAAARNAGIQQANGRYVCFLDSDDWWHHDKLMTQLDYMEAENVALSYMSYSRVCEKELLLKQVEPPPSTSYKRMLSTNDIGNLTAMVRRDLIQKHDIKFKKVGHEDYVFWLTVLKHVGKAHCVPIEKSLCFYTVRERSLSANKLKAAKWQWHVYRNKAKLNFASSCRHFISYVAAACLKRRS